MKLRNTKGNLKKKSQTYPEGMKNYPVSGMASQVTQQNPETRREKF
jgi:hypothetical protein